MVMLLGAQGEGKGNVFCNIRALHWEIFLEPESGNIPENFLYYEFINFY